MTLTLLPPPRVFAALALSLSLGGMPALGQEAETDAPEDPAEIAAQIAAFEAETNGQIDGPVTAQERRDEALELARLEPLDPATILGDQEAIDTYRVSYQNAAAAAQKIYDTFDAFQALRNLTPAEAEELFPEGGYDDALNAASDAHFWAVEDGATAATDLAEARERVAGGRALTEADIQKIDTILGL